MRSFKLSITEQKLLAERTLHLNKKLVAKGIMPLKESEVVHCLLALALERMEVDRQGNIGFFPEEQMTLNINQLERREH